MLGKKVEARVKIYSQINSAESDKDPPNPALQPTWQGAAKNCLNAFLCLSVKCFLEEAGPRG
jgi:hypothetical protein